MAIKQIDLVINTCRGEKNVRKLQQVAKQVEKTFGNINKLKISCTLKFYRWNRS